MQVLCRLSPYIVEKAAFQLLLCKALVCIAELMAFKMSKGNVAHGKRKLLALCGFSSKIGSRALCTLMPAIHSARDLSLLSQRMVNSSSQQ